MPCAASKDVKNIYFEMRLFTNKGCLVYGKSRLDQNVEPTVRTIPESKCKALYLPTPVICEFVQ